MCILLDINTSMEPITTEVSHRLTDKQTEFFYRVTFVKDKYIKKKLAFGKFFFSFLRLDNLIDIIDY